MRGSSRTAVVGLALVTAVTGCSFLFPFQAGDAGVEADDDGDGDADADGDGDADADTDGDGDADADSDGDADGDGDAATDLARACDSVAEAFCGAAEACCLVDDWLPEERGACTVAQSQRCLDEVRPSVVASRIVVQLGEIDRCNPFDACPQGPGPQLGLDVERMLADCATVFVGQQAARDPCEIDEECSTPGFECVRGSCAVPVSRDQECTTTDECEGDLVCGPYLLCEPRGGMYAECLADSCDVCLTCQGFQCLPLGAGGFIDAYCGASADCCSNNCDLENNMCAERDYCDAEQFG